jgi:hypothetical protein
MAELRKHELLTSLPYFPIFFPMPNFEPLEREPHTQYRVFLIEKLIINFALPSDLIFHTLRAWREKDTSQTVLERIVAMWNGKVSKYQKLLRVKDENGGVIPLDYQELCRQTPCGKARLYLASLPWRNPKRKRSRLIAAQKVSENAAAPAMPPAPPAASQPAEIAEAELQSVR